MRIAGRSRCEAGGKERVQLRALRRIADDLPPGAVDRPAEITGNPIVQVHITTTFVGRIRAWGLHQRSSDRLFVVSGLVKIVVYDGRRDSPTFGVINEFTVSEKNPGLLTIAPNLYHGWKNIGVSEAIIINMPDRMYDHTSPDALDLPYDSEAAQRIVPYRFA